MKIRRIFDQKKAFEYSTNFFHTKYFFKINSSNIRHLRIFDEFFFLKTKNIRKNKKYSIEYFSNSSNIFDFRIRRIFWKIRRIFAIVELFHYHCVEAFLFVTALEYYLQKERYETALIWFWDYSWMTNGFSLKLLSGDTALITKSSSDDPSSMTDATWLFAICPFVKLFGDTPRLPSEAALLTRFLSPSSILFDVWASKLGLSRLIMISILRLNKF